MRSKTIPETDLRPARISQTECAALIDATNWSFGFEYQQIEILCRFMSPFRIQEGGVIFREGAAESFMGLVVEGEAAVVKQGARGQMKTIATLGRGKSFGEMSLIDGERRSASVFATTDTVVMLLSKDSFNTMAKKSPALTIAFLTRLAKLMSHRLRETSSRLVDALVP